MSIRDKYNKTSTEGPQKLTPAEALIERSTEKNITVNTEKNNSVQKKKATFEIAATLHTKLKTQAAIEGRNMAEIVSEAVESYLSAHND